MRAGRGILAVAGAEDPDTARRPRPRPGNSPAPRSARRRASTIRRTRAPDRRRASRAGAMPRQVKLTGGWSGSSATVSIGSGGANSRDRARPMSRPAIPGVGRQLRRPAGPSAPARRLRPARSDRAAARRRGWPGCRSVRRRPASGSSTSDEIICLVANGSATVAASASSRCRSRDRWSRSCRRAAGSAA